MIRTEGTSRAFYATLRFTVIAATLFLAASVLAAERTFAERLGWKSNDVVVIFHVDDVAMSLASNRGAVEAVEKGVANSWSLMMPCPWVPEIARYLKEHPDMDSGLHLTLTSEWALYRWGPLAGKSQVPGLVDHEGCLWRSIEQVARKATPDEVEREIRAQIDRAESLGLPITHLDSHMGALFARPDYFERFVKVGIEKGIPILAVGGHMTHVSGRYREAALKLRPWVKTVWNGGLPVIDDLCTGFTRTKSAEKTDKLLSLLKEFKPGVTEILFHASLPTEDFRVITASSDARHADLKALTDPRVKKLIAERGIIPTTWKELMQRRKKAEPME
jgi:predicted glycoside hydrolase/deacetylase ChbG (UPF0249 family)